MSSRESRAVVRGSARRRRWSKETDPLNMSDLRIVLLGKSVSESSGVGNFLLGRAAFDSEAPPDVVERVGGRLKDRHVMVINSPRLLQTNISDHQITQTVRECVYLSDPGPHVIVLLLKHEQCSAEDQECVQKVLDSFSEHVYQHTMVLTTQELTETNDILQKIIQKCSNRHFSLQRSSSPDDLLQAFEDIVQMNDGRHLDCAEGSQYVTKEQQATERLSEGVKLNLVVCGSDGTLKSSISVRILRDVELHGRLISLLELPALIRLSEEEVMRQTFHLSKIQLHDIPVSNLSSRRIVLLGNGGVGKSAAGNTILGKNVFKTDFTPESVTHGCSVAHATVSGRSVSVVDTPPFFDTHIKHEQSMTEIARSVHLSRPGPHVFLIVFSVGWKITEEDRQIIQKIEMMFGEEVFRYSIVLFTFGDQIRSSIEEIIERNSKLRRLVDQCGGRYHVFNNEDEKNREQVNDLLQKIDSMIEQNGGGHYSNEMYEDAQRRRQTCVCS